MSLRKGMVSETVASFEIVLLGLIHLHFPRKYGVRECGWY